MVHVDRAAGNIELDGGLSKQTRIGKQCGRSGGGERLEKEASVARGCPPSVLRSCDAGAPILLVDVNVFYSGSACAAAPAEVDSAPCKPLRTESSVRVVRRPPGSPRGGANETAGGDAHGHP